MPCFFFMPKPDKEQTLTSSHGPGGISLSVLKKHRGSSPGVSYPITSLIS